MISTKDGILAAVGHTPMVRLRYAIDDLHFELFAKLEALNPGGSVKDRPALEIIRHGLEAGFIQPDTVVIESSSGNMAIGLAQTCCYLGLRFICVVDPKTTEQNIDILKAYGVQIEMVTQPDSKTGEYLPARLERVQSLCRKIPGSYWPNQYANLWNSGAHRRTTMPEIVAELGEVDYLFAAASTCGAVTGCAEYVHENGLGTKVIAVDAEGSAIFGGVPKKRLIPGHGASMRPALCRPELIHSCVHVSDLDCVLGCRRLLRREAILAGGSSGGVVTAVARIKRKIPPGATCVMILADRGERYLDTVYSDAWVHLHFGDISKELRECQERQTWTTVTFS
jgi:N-(2-amino-2-carboxyethyl)-L-glutamate synthase